MKIELFLRQRRNGWIEIVVTWLQMLNDFFFVHLVRNDFNEWNGLIAYNHNIEINSYREFFPLKIIDRTLFFDPDELGIGEKTKHPS